MNRPSSLEQLAAAASVALAVGCGRLPLKPIDLSQPVDDGRSAIGIETKKVLSDEAFKDLFEPGCSILWTDIEVDKNGGTQKTAISFHQVCPKAKDNAFNFIKTTVYPEKTRFVSAGDQVVLDTSSQNGPFSGDIAKEQPNGLTYKHSVSFPFLPNASQFPFSNNKNVATSDKSIHAASEVPELRSYQKCEIYENKIKLNYDKNAKLKEVDVSKSALCSNKEGGKDFHFVFYKCEDKPVVRTTADNLPIVTGCQGKPDFFVDIRKREVN